MSNPESKQEKQRRHERFCNTLKDLGSRLASMLVGNWGSKLLALLIAVVLWAGLISQDPSLTREKTFNDVSVNIIGEESLKRNGYIVLEDLDELLQDVQITVNVPQGQYNTVQPSNYSVRLDLSRINHAGEQEVRILSTNSSTYGTVVRISPATVKLNVDEYITRSRIPVTVNTVGEVPEGFWANAPTSDPPQVAITGPRSVVERIVNVHVTSDRSMLPAREGRDRRSIPFELMDANGDPVHSSLVQVTTEGVLLDSVTVESQIYPTRVVEMDPTGIIVGTPAPGYEVKGVYITPGEVMIAGRGSILDEINMFYANGTVSVEGMSQSAVATIRVRQSSMLEYVSIDTVTVALEIGPIEVDRSWSYVPVLVQNLADGLEATLDERTVTVFATGAQNWLDSLSRSDLSVRCDLNGVTEPGTYIVSLMCSIDGADGQTYTCTAEPAIVQVTISAAEE